MYKDLEKLKAYRRDYYAKNKQSKLNRQNLQRQEWRKYLEEIKAATPCMDCGVSYPSYVMDFDHVRGEKLYDVSKVARFASFEALKEEITKCELVCSNCHRIRTHTRKSMGHSQVG